MTYSISSQSVRCVVAALACCVALSSPVLAETTECTVIDSLPYIIADQGVYCLKASLGTDIATGNAITINTNNVTIDLNGFKLGGLAAGPSTQAIGIFAEDRKNITIRNGIIRGFYFAINLLESPTGLSLGHLIEDVRADQNRAIGIQVFGHGTIVRRNQVVTTGGGDYAYGIATLGDGVRILDNDVTDTQADSSWAIGIEHARGTGAVLKNNRVSGVTNLSYPTQTSGIDLYNSPTSGMVIANEVSDTGQDCISFADGATGIYRNNTVSGCTTDYSGGTDGGGNFPDPSP